MFVFPFTAAAAVIVIATALWRLRGSESTAPAGPAGLASDTGRGDAVGFQAGTDPGFTGDGLRPRASVSVVVPALNEEYSVDWVVENIPHWVSEIVLVDGLSVDGTELVVTDRHHDVVIVHQRVKGKGAALRAGFAAASGDIVVMIDADGSTDPREMGRFVDALVAGADFVKGSRNLPGGGSIDFTLLRHLGNLGFVYAANILFGSRFTDLCYGYCAFWRRDLDRLALTADGFEIEMELILSAVKAGFTIAEVPSMELERRAGNSNLNAWKDGWRVLRTLLYERIHRLDFARAEVARVHLATVELAAHGSEQWRPAGSDRRRPLADDNRLGLRARAGYTGPDNRVGERRTQPETTVEVLVALTPSQAVKLSGPTSLYARVNRP